MLPELNNSHLRLTKVAFKKRPGPYRGFINNNSQDYLDQTPCKSDHKIRCRQQFVLLPVNPPAGFMVLAFRTTAMTAGHGVPLGVSTLITDCIYLSGIRCSAAANGIKRIQMSGQELI